MIKAQNNPGGDWAHQRAPGRPAAAALRVGPATTRRHIDRTPDTQPHQPLSASPPHHHLARLQVPQPALARSPPFPVRLATDISDGSRVIIFNGTPDIQTTAHRPNLLEAESLLPSRPPGRARILRTTPRPLLSTLPSLRHRNSNHLSALELLDRGTTQLFVL